MMKIVYQNVNISTLKSSSAEQKKSLITQQNWSYALTAYGITVARAFHYIYHPIAFSMEYLTFLCSTFLNFPKICQFSAEKSCVTLELDMCVVLLHNGFSY